MWASERRRHELTPTQQRHRDAALAAMIAIINAAPPYSSERSA
jgi:hypothetical protein